MKRLFLTTLSFLSLLIPLSLAQSLADLPACAQQAALAGITSTGCGLTDIACVCKSVPFLQALRQTITTTCSANEQSQALTFAQTLCSSVGIAIDVPPIAGVSSSPAAPAVVPVSSTSIAMAMTMPSPPPTPTPAIATASSMAREASISSMMMSMSDETSTTSIADMSMTMTETGTPTGTETGAAQFTGAAMGLPKAPVLVAAAVVGVAARVVAAL